MVLSHANPFGLWRDFGVPQIRAGRCSRGLAEVGMEASWGGEDDFPDSLCVHLLETSS